MRLPACLVLFVMVAGGASAQEAPLTRADTLRGSLTPERTWWDVTHYDLDVHVQPADSTIRGTAGITYRVTGPARELQVDLQEPLVVDRVTQDGAPLNVRRDGNALFVTPTTDQPLGALRTLTVAYHGRPRVAANAPWDGGFVWASDSLGRPFVATAVQGLGASAWWPTKDTQADEPDSQRVAITVPRGLMNVSNGRLRSTRANPDGTTTFTWAVTRPINNYDIAVNAAHYAHFSDTFEGENGTLTLDYYPLDYNLARAQRQFQQVGPMMACFEDWFGPFPWYEDGFTLVETPHLGMEHQSAVAYGNRYQNGYRGRDLSGTGVGLSWDFIIIHESAHEWWGNSITSQDVADMWVHESFANYAENLYVECLQGAAAGAQYVIGTRRAIRNEAPILGTFGVQREGSGDMYYKGGNMLHTIRQLVGDDGRWRQILRGLQTTFRHHVVTGQQVRDFFSAATGMDLAPVFQQYLETTQVPVLEVRQAGADLAYRWRDVVPGFAMPVDVTFGDGPTTRLHPTEAWQTLPGADTTPSTFAVDDDYYVTLRVVDQP